MAVRSEYEVWKDEITTPKLSIAERVAQWFEPRQAEPETDADPYVWHDIGELMERGR